jgi:hypothetical protein
MVVLRRGASRSGFVPSVRVVAAVLAMSACSDGGRPGVPPALSSAVAQTSTSTEGGTAATPQPPAPVAPTWLELVRLERFREAWTLLSQLPDTERAKPEMRFLLARVAARIGKPEEVVKLTEGPVFVGFEEEVAELRAEASLAAGPYEAAATFFEKRGSASDLVKASRAALALRPDPGRSRARHGAEAEAHRRRAQGPRRPRARPR